MPTPSRRRTRECRRLQTSRHLAIRLSAGERTTCTSLDQALLVEATVIDALRLAGLSLSNKVLGHGTTFGHRHRDELDALLGAEPCPIEPAHRAVLTEINQLHRYGMGDDDVYEATRKWWREGFQYRMWLR